MLADDFVGAVTLDPFCPRIPAGDQPVRIEHVECIVSDARDQEPELALAFTQRLVRLLPLGNVARDYSL
jgi:hypothetical protein